MTNLKYPSDAKAQSITPKKGKSKEYLQNNIIELNLYFQSFSVQKISEVGYQAIHWRTWQQMLVARWDCSWEQVLSVCQSSLSFKTSVCSVCIAAFDLHTKCNKCFRRHNLL